MTDFRAKVYRMSADDHRNYQACYPTAVDKAMDVIFDRLNGLPLEQLIGFLRRGNAGPNSGMSPSGKTPVTPAPTGSWTAGRPKAIDLYRRNQ